jgi:hypothetical protein
VLEDSKKEVEALSASAPVREFLIAAAVDISRTQAVAGAGADAAQQRLAFNAITRLAACLPNNPRQIKRIFMAFATYAQVGQKMYGYQPTPSGDNGELSARRWRQLAMWVTLVVDWPETWRAIARRPGLLDAAYGPKTRRATLDRALLKRVPESERPEVRATLERMRADPALVALLSANAGKVPADAGEFATTAMEPAAVYEFNRIIWEPGFLLEPEVAA